MKSLTACCALLACGASAAFGFQTPTPSNPTAKEILARTAAVYRSLQSYELRITVQTVRGGDASEARLTVMGSEPGKFRIQTDAPRGELRVADGRQEWRYNPASGEYSKAPLGPDARTPISGLQQLDQDVASASIAREEQFVVDGKPVPVYVIRVSRSRWPADSLPGAQNAMYRIDRRSFKVYKAITYAGESTTQIVLYSIVKWNQPVPESLFAFTPPASAHEAKAVAASAQAAASIVGTEAPDFTLRDAAGRAVNLKELRGKVVIVDFWATWCPPCREEMPQLQEMHRNLADKGLVVLGLDVGEDAETVTRFAKENSYTFPLLLGAEPDISARYYVEAYPTTFVIDRQGRIAFRELGGASPDKLKSAVAAALAAR